MQNLVAIVYLLFGTAARRDLWGVMLWCFGVWWVADSLDLFESLHDATRGLERYNIDEIISVGLALPLALFVYALRRNAEMQREVAHRRAAEAAVRRLAHFDALTGLPNRSLFDDRLAQGIARARRHQDRLAVLFIDLDGFKAVNDQYGHAAGDTLLREVAGRIREAVRKHDTAARLGGDEFVVILDPVASSDEAAQIAERLVESIGQPCALATGTAAIGASIGIALFSGQGEESDEQLLRNADKAMYDAKAEGKNRYRIYLPPAVGVPAPR